MILVGMFLAGMILVGMILGGHDSDGYDFPVIKKTKKSWTPCRRSNILHVPFLDI